MNLREHINKTVKHYSRYNKQYFRNKFYDSNLRKTGEGFFDKKRLLNEFPGFDNFHARHKAPFTEMILPHYRDYVSTISSEIMAASFELSVFLLTFSKFTGPAKILDFGSGFTSFIFRFYAGNLAENKPEIWTVDDSPEWLNKTGSFLKNHSVDPDNLFSLEEVRDLEKNSFDLILYDFGAFDTRMSTLEFALNLLSEKGNIITDDMHAADYALFVKKTALQKKMDSYSLHYFTIDKMNRFSFLLKYK
jgi:predicted O-methyltransferase YrrM